MTGDDSVKEHADQELDARKHPAASRRHEKKGAQSHRTRGRAADIRDVGAARRDTEADNRDLEAAERDDRAGDRDTATEEEESGAHDAASDSRVINRLASARRSAHADRDDARHDREAAARDRVGAGADRSAAKDDRRAAAEDREQAARDRDECALDDVTGLWSRGPGLLLLRQEHARARRASEPLSVAFIDVVGLKAVNDSEGHAAGDELLRAVASELRAYVRSYDSLVRYGGDEFVCALPGLDVDSARKRLSQVNVALAARGAAVTIGLAELQPSETIEALIARADADLYRQRGQ